MDNMYTNISNASEPNSTTKETEQTPEFPKSFTITATVFFALIFLLGISGNILVISVVYLNKNMKNSVNMYLLNLCVADILVLTICMPTALADIYTRTAWYFGEEMCKLVPYLENTVAHASVFTILAISSERYKVVCYPLKIIEENYKKVGKIIFVIWVISAAVSAPLISMPIYKDSVYKDGTPFKACRTYLYLQWQKAYIVVLSVFFFVLPSLILLGLYCKICHVLYVARKESIRLGQTNTYKDKKRLKRQIINILTSIVLLFFVCHLPYRVLGIWMTFGSGREIRNLGFETYYNILYSSRIMFYLNHAANPIIYNFVSTKFRNALKYMITAKTAYGPTVSILRHKKIQDYSRYSHGRPNQMLSIRQACRSQERKSQSCIKRRDLCADKQKRNEYFFLMYASKIDEEAIKAKDFSSSDEVRCEPEMALADKGVSMCMNNKNTNRKNKVNNNGFNLVSL